MNKPKVLTIDDDPAILMALGEFLQLEGYTVVQASSLATAYQVLETNTPDITVTDFELQDGNALEFLATVKKMNTSMPCIIMTGHATIDLAVRAIKEGADHFLTKPVQFSTLSSIMHGCLELQQIKRKQLARSLQRSRYEKDPFQGSSDAIRRLKEKVLMILEVDRPVLIIGETGTGKGVLAEWMHKNGPRADEALVDVNCAGLSKDLLESELFGYERGAFTGAITSKQGLIEVAHRGILFLDEIGEMDILVQPKLLKVLESRRFRRLGDVRERTADIQIMAATNRDLMQWAKQGKFRDDLYFRLSTFDLHIPPLRDRREDIPVLANSLLRTLASDLAREPQELSSGAEAALSAYPWPGNIRELRNVLERVVITCRKQVIGPDDIGLQQRAQAVPVSSIESDLTLAELERQHITRILQAESGRVAQAATRLGIPRSTLYQKIKAYGLQTEAGQ